MRARATVFEQHEVTTEPDQFGRSGNACQPQTRTDRAFMHAALRRQPRVFGVQENRQIERRGVGQRIFQYIAVADRVTGIRHADAADVLQRGHLGQHRTAEVMG